MKLLFDQNLSPRLAQRLDELFPGSQHVSVLGLDRATDQEIWDFARENNYVIVTKDADFAELSTLRGFPPQIVWLRMGNSSTVTIEAIIRRESEKIQRLEMDRKIGIVSLF